MRHIPFFIVLAFTSVMLFFGAQIGRHHRASEAAFSAECREKFKGISVRTAHDRLCLRADAILKSEPLD